MPDPADSPSAPSSRDDEPTDPDAEPSSPDAGPTGPGAGAPHAESGPDEPPVRSRWWYWIAATPLYFLLTFVLGVWAFLVAVGSLVAMPVSPRVGVGFGLVFVLVALVVALVGLGLLLVFPLALYLDAQAVTRANLDWQPDGVLYALLGLVTAFTTGFLLSLVVAGYYLYQRHEHVDVP